MTHKLDPPDGFKWQGAYGAFTVSKSDVPRITAYIANQEAHHRERSLEEEFEPAVWPQAAPTGKPNTAPTREPSREPSG